MKKKNLSESISDSNSSDDDDAEPHEFFDAKDVHDYVDQLDLMNIETKTNETKNDNENIPSASATTSNLLHDRLNNDNSSNNVVDKSPEDPYFVDEEMLKENEKLLTDEDKQRRLIESKTCKEEGNDLFGRSEFDLALAKYSEALCLCPLSETKDRAVVYSNRAACLMKLEKYEAAIQSCTKSIELDPQYLKPLTRRAEAYKQIDKLDEALQDYQRVIQIDPSNAQARRACHTLPDQIKERNEKMKDEMLGKLKRFG